VTGRTLAAIREHMSTIDMAGLTPEPLVDQFSTSYSTFLRMLKDEGTSFRAEVNWELKRRVVELLADDPQVSGHKMAHACGFASPDNVYRSWPFWFGGKYNKLQGTRNKYEPKT
jgi:hypothetical protein